LTDNKLVNPKLLLDLPATPGAIGNGGKVIVGPDNNVSRLFDIYVDLPLLPELMPPLSVFAAAGISTCSHMLL
jgi:hypothetical protein